jgi:hypothetical protein
MTQLGDTLPLSPGLLLSVVLLYHRTLQESASSGNHMATNLAKWWKTKILNGYRQFTGKYRIFSHVSRKIVRKFLRTDAILRECVVVM